jgi:Spy/CpxP family protein refolding chaperone
VAALGFVAAAAAQGPPGHGPGQGPGGGGGRPPFSRGGPDRDWQSPDIAAGKWWTKPGIVRRLGLSDDQQKRLDQVYQQARLKLIDLRAALEKEEALLEPMLAPDRPQEAAVLAQIDRIAEVRAELEKTNARMLFAFRMVLTPEQWKELQVRDSGPGRRAPATLCRRRFRLR